MRLIVAPEKLRIDETLGVSSGGCLLDSPRRGLPEKLRDVKMVHFCGEVLFGCDL